MAGVAGSGPALRWAVRLTVLALVVLWLVPTLGLLVSSFRDRDRIAASGWWEAPLPVVQTRQYRAPADAAVLADGRWIIAGSVLGPGEEGEVLRFGGLRSEPESHDAGETAELRGGRRLTVHADGAFVLDAPRPFARDPSVYYAVATPPALTLDNYRTILFSEGMDRAFLNTLTVAIPATLIPILIAAFAAYALAWMRFAGRNLLIALVVGLLVVPLQLALVPLLQLHNALGIGQSFLGIWLAHTGFGLPLAIFLLRNYMAGLPREIIESARVDGATDFQVFTRIVLPLSFPALAAFAIFQFLWTWNDLLVAKVFLPPDADSRVMTVKIADDLLGSRGGDWGLLAAAAFVSIAVPLAVFFTLQRYLVRGLLAVSVKQ